MSIPLLRRDFLGFPCHVAICDCCGLVKLNPRWEDEKYQDFYARKYDWFYRGPDKTAVQLFKIDLESKGPSFRERLRKLPLSRDTKVLDVGAGTGWSFEAIPGPSKIQAHAIESSPKCLDQLRARGVHIVGTDLSCSFGAEYDLVVARALLEHAMAPISILTKMRDCTKDDGFIYVAVPNALRFNPNKASSFFRHIHTYYFNIHTLLRMCSKAGLYAVDAGDESESWAILTRHRTDFRMPEVSPQEQRRIVEKILTHCRFPVAKRLWALLRRLRYWAL